MGNFGTRVKVNNDMSSYIIGIVAPSGFGKSTLMKNVAEKLYGQDGYICADFGQEDGYSAIHGAVVEKCPNWKHFKLMVDDIVKNKDTDYAALKVVIWDTLDAAFECAEKFSIDSFNKEHLGEQGFRPASSINSVDGGFGNGLNRCISVVKKEIDRLKSVNVGCWFTAHCKERDQSDLFSGATYTQLTASLTNKYFGSIQNISHIIGFGYFSREMQHIEVGKENPVTKKKKSREEVTKEERRIRFRDSDYICAAKSRFADIEPEINLDCDEFISAIQSAINSAGGENISSTPKKSTAPTPAPTPISEPELEEDPEIESMNEQIEKYDESTTDEDFDLFDEEETPQEEEAIVPVDNDTLTEIRSNFKSADSGTKAQVKVVLGNYGGKLSSEMKPSDVEKIKEILGI